MKSYRDGKMKYAIKKLNGQWWTGTCWGVWQAREEYDAFEHLPKIDGLELINSGDPLDVCYCDPTEDLGFDVVARVYAV